jgi:hypothetical protein
MKMTAMIAALDRLRDHAEDFTDYDILAVIAEAVEATADELAEDQPSATITIGAWRTAAGVLWDIADAMPEDEDDEALQTERDAADAEGRAADAIAEAAMASHKEAAR